jgi:2-keto-4-pentenoate hydratase/2-oxohepta-3-ene-1,7-dioic acid hydratase in catechol pathway
MTPSLHNVRNVWAIGRNYADHARELGHQVPTPTEAPMIFLKAGTSIVSSREIHLQRDLGSIHHEVEIALRFGASAATPGASPTALSMLTHIAIALDLTARDVQNQLKAKGQPWTLAKSFRNSCVLSQPVELKPSVSAALNRASGAEPLELSLWVNGELRQRGSSHDMIHSVEAQAQYVLKHFPVVEGDWLLTGTPAGVAALAVGDQLRAEINSVTAAEWLVI